MIMLCTVELALSTVPKFHRKLTRCELLEYLEHSEHDYFEKARAKFGDPDCSGFHYGDDYDLDDDDLNWMEYEDGNKSISKSNITLPDKRVPLFVFDVLEMITGAFFTVDMLLRLFSCPSFVRFFRSVINIFDILALIGFYIHVAVINIEKEHKYEIGWIRIINFLQIFRVMRLFRIIRNVRASRVLAFSIRQNGRDMTLLVLLVMITVSTAASLVYFLEDRSVIESIPVAWYWAMITLTTVGYGDITPKSCFGRVVAALLAICGVLLLAITLPMFVNNFLTLYQYSCVDETIQDRSKQRKKLKGAIIATGVACKPHVDTVKNDTDTCSITSDVTMPVFVLPNDKASVNNVNKTETSKQ